MPVVYTNVLTYALTSDSLGNMTTNQPISSVPGHIRTANPPGNFCTREGELAPGGRCPDGCDHADHYSNDGHPECEEQIVLKDFTLTDAGRRKVEKFLADRKGRA